MKRIFIVLAFIAITVVCQAYDVEINGIYYNLNHNQKTAEVTYGGNSCLDFESYEGSVVIPDRISVDGQDYNVTRIKNQAFYFCKSLTSIVVGKNVQYIGNMAFRYCHGLNAIEVDKANKYFNDGDGSNCIIDQNGTLIAGCNNTIIPNSVKTIGDYVFAGCLGLTSVVIPNSVTNIKGGAFGDCSELSSVELSTSLTNIGAYAFKGCSSLTSLEIPNLLTTIGECAFEDCKGLTTMAIPNSVKSIESKAFWGCSNLKSINIPNSLTVIKSNTFSMLYLEPSKQP